MQADMQNYFTRQIKLWGEQTQELLQQKSVAIIGAGGLGSSLAFGLGSSGIGTIHIVDFDRVSLSNIHRQITFTTEDEGAYKAECNAEMIKRRCPYTKPIAHTCDFASWSQKGIEVDLLIDATDNLPSRGEIDEYAKSKGLPWLYGSVEAFNGQVCFFDQASFRDFFTIKERTPAGIAAPIVMHIASLQANLALRYLAGLAIKRDYVYYLYFDEAGELMTQKFSIASSS